VVHTGSALPAQAEGTREEKRTGIYYRYLTEANQMLPPPLCPTALPFLRRSVPRRHNNRRQGSDGPRLEEVICPHQESR